MIRRERWQQPSDEDYIDTQEYVEGLKQSSVPVKQMTAQLSDLARALDGSCRASVCDGTYRTISTWSDETPEKA